VILQFLLLIGRIDKEVKTPAQLVRSSPVAAAAAPLKNH
jgi:hypothetical protein